MLGSVLRGSFKKFFRKDRDVKEKDRLANAAADDMAKGNHRAAIALYRQYLKIDPENAAVLNNLGVCLGEIGNNDEAYETFALAYRLDDANMAVVVNHARQLVDSKKTTEAIAQLIRARVTIPRYPYINAVYAAVCLSLGDAAKAKAYALQAWLAQFDSLRLANSHLFSASYADIPEALLAAEHRFWGETSQVPQEANTDMGRAIPRVAENTKKLRIGYWSPDFRSHSVRYFFRPLLEGHDRERVEIFLYHDFHAQDEQTAEIKARCDQFHDVYELKDSELVSLIRAHQLDVLVELAGHTSNNRLNLLNARMARIQLTGIGYPSTTGLATLDGKFLDPYLMGLHPERFYSEKPFVLKNSFWCFDPHEEATISPEPPKHANGYVTFACVGNAAKINDRILECWAEILRQVPTSRLVLRSVNFVDPAAVSFIEKKISACKIERSRVDIVGPAAGQDFFNSYNQIDIILDTYPFNGGTTTCFAVHMGVPVVTLAGESLISRMGYSILSNVRAADLAVHDVSEYVQRAVKLANDEGYRTHFRDTIRERLQASSLGNGAIFAADFEAACRNLLNLASGAAPYISRVDVLPPEELVRRAYIVLGYEQADAAKRIVAHCLREYPDFAPAHILATESMTADGDYVRAANYLTEKRGLFVGPNLSAALINIIRFHILAGDFAEAREVLHQAKSLAELVPLDSLLLRLYECRIDDPAGACVQDPKKKVLNKTVCCAIPCDDNILYTEIVNGLKLISETAENIEVEYIRVNESRRQSEYEELINMSSADIIVFLQKNVDIKIHNFFQELVFSLEKVQMVGYFGCKRWVQLEWATDAFEEKACGYMSASREKAGLIDVNFCGNDYGVLVEGLAVLDGGLLAFDRKSLQTVGFDEELTSAGNLLEEEWSYAASRAGVTLGVHRNLGIRTVASRALDQKYLASAKTYLVEKMGFDPFSLAAEDSVVVSVPCVDETQALRVMGNYLESVRLLN